MAGRTVAIRIPLGRIGIHVNIERIPPTLGASRGNVFWGGNHNYDWLLVNKKGIIFTRERHHLTP